VQLNHGDLETELEPGFQLGPMEVVGHAEWHGEDDTVWNSVLERDGWTRGSRGKMKFHGMTKGWASDPPVQCTKTHPTRTELALEMSIVGIGGDQGTPWYQINYRLLNGNEEIVDLGIIDWADWDHGGDLVFAKAGCLFRQRLDGSRSAVPAQIADFNGLKFENVPAPAEAQRW
jgi:hypothetical protein